MRIKLLAAIAGFLLTSVVMSSCLGGDDDTTEYSPNAVLQSFELDTIYGVTYKFTIDQINGKVYNQDSLPVGADTIINKILITNMSVSGLMSIRNYNDTEDSLFTISDSVNLAGTMEKPFRVKVWAPDMLVTKEYQIEVRVHKQVPDSLSWGSGAWTTNFAPTIAGKQKAAILNKKIFVYADNQPVYSSATSDGKVWIAQAANGLPSTDITSITNFQNRLYATVKGSNKAYRTEDGINWEDASLGDNVVRLIAPINGTLTGIINSGDTQLFATTDGATWTTNGEVPEDFPVNNISAVNYKNNIGVENVLAVGRMANPTATDTATVAWGYMSGQQWVELSTESKYKCPLLETPTIIYYGGTIYTLGKDFTTFYYSVAGLVWKSVDSLFMLPEQLRGAESDYSMVVDDDNYIWIMRSSPNEVWRGRLNRLGFLVQE
jgi:hypothetical protein